MLKTFSIIVAADQNNGIGLDNKLPWRLKDDMAFFKATTTQAPEGMKNVVIMGRKTYESIPQKFRPLPDRINIVLTRDKNKEFPGALVYQSLDSALSDSYEGRLDANINKVFVIGGAEIYNQSFSKDDLELVYLTRVHHVFNCDTHCQFVDNVNDKFTLTNKIDINGEEFSYAIETYKNIPILTKTLSKDLIKH